MPDKEVLDLLEQEQTNNPWSLLAEKLSVFRPRKEAPVETLSPERQAIQDRNKRLGITLQEDIGGHVRGAFTEAQNIGKSLAVTAGEGLQYLTRVANAVNPILAILPDSVSKKLEQDPEDVKILFPKFIEEQMAPPPPSGLIDATKYFADQQFVQPMIKAWEQAKIDVNYDPSFSDPDALLKGKHPGDALDAATAFVARGVGFSGLAEAVSDTKISPEERGGRLFSNLLLLAGTVMGAKGIKVRVNRLKGLAGNTAPILEREALERVGISNRAPIITKSGGIGKDLSDPEMRAASIPLGDRTARRSQLEVDQSILDQAAKMFPDADTLEDAINTRLGPQLFEVLDNLPNDAKKLQINERLAQALKLQEPIKTEVRRISRAQNISLDDAAQRYVEGNKLLADAIEASARNFGTTGNMFSRFAQLEKVQRLSSKNPKVQASVALERLDGLRVTQSLMQLARSSAVSQVPTAMRNLVAQGARGFMQTLEHAVANSAVAFSEGIKKPENRLAYFTKVNDPAKLDYSKIYADTVADITTITNVMAAPAVSLSARYGPGILKKLPKEYQDTKLLSNLSEVLEKTDTRLGAQYRIPLNDILNEAPVEMLESLGGPISGDIVLTSIADGVRNRFKVGRELRKTAKAELALGERTPADFGALRIKDFADRAATTVTMMNRIVEMEQRRWFLSARMMAHLERNGENADLNVITEYLRKPPEERPAFIDAAVRDSVEYSLKSTFAGNLNKTKESRAAQMAKLPPDVRNALRVRGMNASGEKLPGYGSSLAQSYLDIMQKYPELIVVSPEFPNFIANKYMFLMERNPAAVLDLFSSDFRDALAGKVDNVQLGRIAAKRRLKMGTPEYDALRDQMGAAAAIQASESLAQGMSGLGMLTAAFAVRNSAAAGPRWNQLDIGLRGEKDDTIDYFNVRNYDPFASVVALAETLNAVSEGRGVEEVLTTGEALDIAVGIRSLENTGLKFADAFREFDAEGDVMEQTGEIIKKLLGSKLGMMTVFFRQFKDLASITDLRVPGVFKGSEEGEFLSNDRNPFFAPALSNLPTGLLETLGLGQPPAIDPRTGQPSKSPNEALRFFAGLTTERRTRLDQVLDAIAESPTFITTGRTSNKNTRDVLQKWWGGLVTEVIGPDGYTYGDSLADDLLALDPEEGSEVWRKEFEAIASDHLNFVVGKDKEGNPVTLQTALILEAADELDDPTMEIEIEERKGTSLTRALDKHINEGILRRSDRRRRGLK